MFIILWCQWFNDNNYDKFGNDHGNDYDDGSDNNNLLIMMMSGQKWTNQSNRRGILDLVISK